MSQRRVSPENSFATETQPKVGASKRGTEKQSRAVNQRSLLFDSFSRLAVIVWIFVLGIMTVCAITVPALAAPDFTRGEKQALLEYARGCLIAQLGGAAAPVPPPSASRQQRACFVTFFNGKRVFACFGGFSPRRSNLAEEISENVRLALKNDPRSRTATTASAAGAGVQITFPLGQPERVADYRSIDPASEGMFVESASGGVAFVPGEARTANWAFREALRRLGERDPAAVAVYRFKAEALSTRRGGEL